MGGDPRVTALEKRVEELERRLNLSHPTGPGPLAQPFIVTNAHPCMCGTSYASLDTMGNCGRCGGRR